MIKIIEFAGLPATAKTSTIAILEDYFTKNGISYKLIKPSSFYPPFSWKSTLGAIVMSIRNIFRAPVLSFLLVSYLLKHHSISTRFFKLSLIYLQYHVNWFLISRNLHMLPRNISVYLLDGSPFNLLNDIDIDLNFLAKDILKYCPPIAAERILVCSITNPVRSYSLMTKRAHQIIEKYIYRDHKNWENINHKYLMIPKMLREFSRDDIRVVHIDLLEVSLDQLVKRLDVNEIKMT